jgi:hypothetical protein
VSRAFPSLPRFILTEIYLCHACSYQKIEDDEARRFILTEIYLCHAWSRHESEDGNAAGRDGETKGLMRHTTGGNRAVQRDSVVDAFTKYMARSSHHYGQTNIGGGADGTGAATECRWTRRGCPRLGRRDGPC